MKRSHLFMASVRSMLLAHSLCFTLGAADRDGVA